MEFARTARETNHVGVVDSDEPVKMVQTTRADDIRPYEISMEFARTAWETNHVGVVDSDEPVKMVQTKRADDIRPYEISMEFARTAREMNHVGAAICRPMKYENNEFYIYKIYHERKGDTNERKKIFGKRPVSGYGTGNDEFCGRGGRWR